MKKLLSICVPCYNAAGYMERCLASLPKGEEDVEILIVNDGSTDGTAGIAERYAAKYPRTVRVIHQENKGHGGAVNTGIREAKGLYFKVVDADDRVRKEPFRRIHAALQTLVAADSSPDMLVSNYVYDKEGEKRHRVMRYANALPQERLFTWEEVMHFRKGQYLLMHSVIFRTALLRVCGLRLPEHSYYVDNLYVFLPLPFVRTMYYLDVNFYDYAIGREGQSVNEQTMIRNVDQQLAVNRRMIDFFASHYDAIASEKKRFRYMFNYLEIIMAVSSVMLWKSGTEENLGKKKDLWTYLRKKNHRLFLKMRTGIVGIAFHLPGSAGRRVTLFLYRVMQRIFHFN
ncbi:MAG: glycosyltransferase family 2 protein [Lachnospiraceae bacterium]|nr:glycosyltransferase family 2 protein [Lachnospiraceae bacterium]